MLAFYSRFFLSFRAYFFRTDRRKSNLHEIFFTRESFMIGQVRMMANEMVFLFHNFMREVLCMTLRWRNLSNICQSSNRRIVFRAGAGGVAAGKKYLPMPLFELPIKECKLLKTKTIFIQYSIGECTLHLHELFLILL